MSFTALKAAQLLGTGMYASTIIVGHVTVGCALSGAFIGYTKRHENPDIPVNRCVILGALAGASAPSSYAMNWFIPRWRKDELERVYSSLCEIEDTITASN
jgi:hypothetical protein